jgi:Arc/MetJ-type ribon-helix-helix transcriptional regulator
MPGQRKEGKKRIAVWLTEEERQMLDVLIEQGAVKDMSDFVKKSLPIRSTGQKNYQRQTDY